MRRVRWLAGLALALSAHGAQGQPLTIWAWERPEDLRFAGSDAEVAVQTGFIELSGDRLIVRGRRHPLQVRAAQVTTSVVHVQIDHRRPLVWTDERAGQVAQAIVRLGDRPGVRRLQLDFEVRASERPILLAVLRGVRARLPEGLALSMTALASWCETESWLDQAPVDEIVPMLFRMGPDGARLKARLAAGGDFANARCRTAFAISTDTPLVRAPAGRRLYLFSHRSWTAADFKRVRHEVAAWPGG